MSGADGAADGHVGLAARRVRAVVRRIVVRRVRVLERQQAGEAELLHVLVLGLDQTGGAEVVVDVDLLSLLVNCRVVLPVCVQL